MLANERTFLSYLRTALAFIAFGFVIARFSLFAREMTLLAHVSVSTSTNSVAFGTGMALVGIVVAFVGAWRYAATDRALRSNRVIALSPRVSYLGASIVGAIGIVVAYELLRIAHLH